MQTRRNLNNSFANNDDNVWNTANTQRKFSIKTKMHREIVQSGRRRWTQITGYCMSNKRTRGEKLSSSTPLSSVAAGHDRQ